MKGKRILALLAVLLLVSVISAKAEEKFEAEEERKGETICELRPH